MISDVFLTMLRCPEDLSKLSLADSALLKRLNEAVAARRLKNRTGQKVEKQFDGALVRADGKIAYPVFDEIPILLVDEGIKLQDL